MGTYQMPQYGILVIKINEWIKILLGPKALEHKEERTLRFFEEAVEVAQAVGINRKQMLNMIDHKLAMPAGDVKQEIAGCGFTLIALASTFNIHLLNVVGEEVDRVSTPEMIAKIQEKHKIKIAAGTSVLKGDYDDND